MPRADRERRREREVGQPVILADLADETLDRLGIRRGLAQEDVLHGSAGVARLERILEIENAKDVVAVVDRQLRRIRVAGLGGFRGGEVAALPAVRRISGKRCRSSRAKRYAVPSAGVASRL